MPGGCRQENINEKNSPLNNIQHVPLMEPDTNTELTPQPKIDNIIELKQLEQVEKSLDNTNLNFEELQDSEILNQKMHEITKNKDENSDIDEENLLEPLNIHVNKIDKEFNDMFSITTSNVSTPNYSRTSSLESLITPSLYMDDNNVQTNQSDEKSEDEQIDINKIENNPDNESLNTDNSNEDNEELPSDIFKYDIDDTDLLMENCNMSRAEIKDELEKFINNSDDDINILSDKEDSINDDNISTNSTNSEEYLTNLSEIFKEFEENNNTDNIEEKIEKLAYVVANINLNDEQTDKTSDKETDIFTLLEGTINIEGNSAQTPDNSVTISQSLFSETQYIDQYKKSEGNIENNDPENNSIFNKMKSKIKNKLEENTLISTLLLIMLINSLGHFAPWLIMGISTMLYCFNYGKLKLSEWISTISNKNEKMFDLNNIEEGLKIKTIQSNISVLEKIEVPYLINNQRHISELDCGAAVNCISANLIKQLLPTYKFLKSAKQYRLNSVEGANIEVESCKKIPCIFDDVGKVFLDFHILKEDNISLLGRPFMTKMNISLEVKGEKITINLNPVKKTKEAKIPYCVNINNIKLSQGEEKEEIFSIKNKGQEELYLPHHSNHNNISIYYRIYKIDRKNSVTLGVTIKNVGENDLVLKSGDLLLGLIPYTPENKKEPINKIKGFKKSKIGSIRKVETMDEKNQNNEQSKDLVVQMNFRSIVSAIFIILQHYIKNNIVANYLTKLVESFPFEVKLKN